MGDGRSRKHDECRRKRECPKRREDPAAYEVPFDREPGDLFRYDNRISCGFPRERDGEMLRGHPPARRESGRENGTRKPLSARKHELDGEARPADAAAAFQNLAAGAGLRPHEKAVCRGALTLLRLIGSFRHGGRN